MQVDTRMRSALVALLATAAGFALAQLFTASAYACHIEGKSDTVGCGGEPDQPPTVSLTKPVMTWWDDHYWNDTVGLEASASDDSSVDRVEFLIGGSVVGTDTTSPYAHSLDTTSMPDGESTVAVRAIDDGGQSTTSDPVTIQIDNTDPEITISDWITRPTRGEEVLGRVQASDAGLLFGHVACLFDGETVSDPCWSGPSWARLEDDGEYFLSRTDLADGEHTLTITVPDVAGNVASITRSFTFDGTPPETTITSGPAEGSTTVSREARFALSANEQVAGFECRLYPAALAGTGNVPAFDSCSDADSHTRSALAAGTYRFEAIAIDKAGNVDPSPVARTFRLAAPPSGGTDTGSPGGDQPATQTPPPPAAPAEGKPGKCAKLKGKKRAACVKKKCGKLKGKKKKACVKKVTYKPKPQARRG